MHNRTAVVCFFGLLYGLAGCGDAQHTADPLLQTWVLEDVARWSELPDGTRQALPTLLQDFIRQELIGRYGYTFKEDGTCSHVLRGKVYTGTYRRSNDSLTVQLNRENGAIAYAIESLDPDFLVLLEKEPVDSPSVYFRVKRYTLRAQPATRP